MFDVMTTHLRQLPHSAMPEYRRAAYVVIDQTPVDVVQNKSGPMLSYVGLFLVMHQNEEKDVLVEILYDSYKSPRFSRPRRIPPRLLHQLLAGTKWESMLVDSENGDAVFMRGMSRGMKPSAIPTEESCLNTNAASFLRSNAAALATFLHFARKMKKADFKMKSLSDARLAARCVSRVMKFREVSEGSHSLCFFKKEIEQRIESIRERIDLLSSNKQQAISARETAIGVLKKYNLLEEEEEKNERENNNGSKQ